MLTNKLILYCKSMGNGRFISQTVRNFASDSAGQASASSSKSMPGRALHMTTAFDKWILVWVKRFPKGQVPDKVSEEVMHQAKSRARVKTANWMIAGTALMCLSTVFYAKKLVKGGDSIQKRQDDWRQKVIEEGKKAAEATK